VAAALCLLFVRHGNAAVLQGPQENAVEQAETVVSGS